jgi:hypothetical protein
MRVFLYKNLLLIVIPRYLLAAQNKENAIFYIAAATIFHWPTGVLFIYLALPPPPAASGSKPVSVRSTRMLRSITALNTMELLGISI